jgi:hypothetical protein
MYKGRGDEAMMNVKAPKRFSKNEMDKVGVLIIDVRNIRFIVGKGRSVRLIF